MNQKGSISTDLIIDLDKYNIYENTIIGSGDYGDIIKASYTVREKDDISYFAITRFTRINNAKDLKDYFNKIMIQTSFYHIAVLPITGYSLPIPAHNYYSIISPIMKNGNLFQLTDKINDGLFPDNFETKRAIITFGIAAGMAHIHQKNVIHQDLKPDNILLDENYYPKISNFNLSKYLPENSESSLSSTDFKIVTPYYCAPELFKDQNYTNKIDVYSYAIILYELWTTKRAFSNHRQLTIDQFKTIISSGQRPPFEDKKIPRIIRKLIERCWNEDPDLRPNFVQIVTDFMESKEKFFNDEFIDKDELNRYMDDAIIGVNFFESLDGPVCHDCGKLAIEICHDCFHPYCAFCYEGHKCEKLTNTIK